MVLEKVFLRKVYKNICLFCSWYSKIAKIDAYVTCHFQEILKENMSYLNLYIPPSGWRCSIELQRDKIGKNWHWKRRLYSCFMSFPFCISKETAKKSFNTKDVIFKGKCRYKEFTLSYDDKYTSTEHRKTTKYAEILRNKGSYVFVYFKS